MRNKFTIEMSSCQAENGFSLDELVKKLAEAFENKTFAEILKKNCVGNVVINIGNYKCFSQNLGQ